MEDLLYELSEPIGLLLASVSLLLYLATLVNAARTGSWVWFVCILITGLAALAYLVFAYQSPRKLREARLRRERATRRRIAVREEELRSLRGEIAALRKEQSGRAEGEPSA